MAGLDIVFIGLLVIVLVPIAMTDLKERRIPNMLNLALGLLGFIHAMVSRLEWHQAMVELRTVILAALAFVATAWIVQRINRQAKIGWGDLKFLTAASLWVGIDGSVAVLFVASIVSLLVALASAPWARLNWRQQRPFGPMLAVGMISVVTLVFSLPGRP